MNFLPTFLSPLAAAIAAAIAIPLLLILYFLKLRRREVAISSTLLWKKAIQDLQVNAPFQKLRRNLLLLLQLLLLIALILALSRPIVNYTPGAGKLSVILIDRSASMSAGDQNGQTRLDVAKRRAKELVDTLGRGSSAMVLAVDDRPETVQTFTTDVLALKRAIDSIQPTHRQTRFKQAYQLADAQTNFNPEQLRTNVKPDVWVFSDGRILDGDELSIRGEVKYEPVGNDQSTNIGIVALSAKRNYEQPNEVQVFARLANYGPQPVNADVQLRVNGQVARIAGTSLPPQRWDDKQRAEAEKEGIVSRDSVEFKIDLLTAATISVEQLHKENDALAADDSAHVVVPPPRNLAVLLVTEGNYFLEKAINSLQLKEPASMLPAAYEEKLPTEYDVILFDRYRPKQLPPSGSFVYFRSTPPPGSKLKPAMTGDVPAPMIDDTITVLDWKRDHPLLRYLNMQKLYVLGMMPLELPLEAEVLMQGDKGPMMVLYREGRHTHLVIPFDVLQSNWPVTQVSWPIFMHNTMQFLAVGSDMDVRQSFKPGDSPRIPRTNLQKLDPLLKSVRLEGPMNVEVPIPETGDFALPALDKVGIYKTVPAIPQFETIAVNLLDDNESNLIPAEQPPGQLGTSVAATGGKARLELWWWLVACAALPLLLIEWWVYTRRVHL